MYAGTQISNISNILDKYRIFQNINVEDFHLFYYISINLHMHLCTTETVQLLRVREQEILSETVHIFTLAPSSFQPYSNYPRLRISPVKRWKLTNFSHDNDYKIILRRPVRLNF
jgi:hypothetical protein